MRDSSSRIKISFNSPVVLGFSIACLAALILNMITKGKANYLLFSVHRAPLSDPLTYFRFFGHVLGHAGWDHFIGNIMMILIVGPLLEEKYGSVSLLFVILITAFVTGLVYFVCFPYTMLLGASGVVFAMILLSSFASMKDGNIPLTFILVAVLYIGGQVCQSILIRDNVSNLTHIVGAFTGAGLGYMMNKDKINRY